MGRRVLTATAALALVIGAGAATGGCGPTSNGPPDPGGSVSDTTAMQAVADQIRADLSGRPGVTSATVAYQDSVTAPAQVYLTISVAAGTALDPVAAEATRLVWLSRLNPLRHIDIRVADVSQNRGTHVVWDLPRDQTQLTTTYGARPTG